MVQDNQADILRRLDRIDAIIAEVHDLLVAQRTIRAWYSTAEAAKVLGKAEFIVREWARLGRIRAEKRPCGRGRFQEWMISHDELTRIHNEGLLPLRKD